MTQAILIFEAKSNGMAAQSKFAPGRPIVMHLGVLERILTNGGHTNP